MYSGIVAVGSLKGPLHGGANEQVMSMLADVKSVDEVDAYLDEKFKNKEKSWDSVIEYTKDGDPRAKYLREMSRKITSETGRSELYDISIAIEKRMKEEKDSFLMSISLVLLYITVWIFHTIYSRQFSR